MDGWPVVPAEESDGRGGAVHPESVGSAEPVCGGWSPGDRQQCGLAVGEAGGDRRKNWLFVGSMEAGSRAAVLMSLVASCKLNQVEPWAYLRDCFEKLSARSPGDSLDDLLPDRWSIGSLRQKERAT